MNYYAVLINNYEEMLKRNMNLVDVIGDCPNIERPIAPETFFCKKLQKKVDMSVRRITFSGITELYHHIIP